MKIVVTADIHYGFGNNQHLVRKLAKKIIKTKADVLLLVGDTFAFNQRLLQECLYLFNGFTGDKLLVAGNHDLWSHSHDSLVLYKKIIPQIAKQCNFHFLDQKPFIKGNVGFVGNIGWYDYSFRDQAKPIPHNYYTEKRWPGVVTYNDGIYVHLGMNDGEFTKRVNKKLRQHLCFASNHADTIVCAVHHIPFRELLRTPHTSLNKYLDAFSGNKETGNIIKVFPKVKYVFCGHTHQRKKAIIGGITVLNIGSDYLRKRYKLVDI